MKIIDQQLLATVTEQAKASPRLRMNYNFHESLDAKAQRLLNALEPGTVLPIHRHQHTPEMYIILKGSIKVLFYNAEGEVTDETILVAGNERLGVDIPAGQWHTLEVLETGTVIFEVKEGPYAALEPSDILEL